jgi:hypothetical protein
MVMFSWELFTEERMQDGRPFTISRKYSWSMHEKSGLRKALEDWRGKKFVEADFGPGGFDIRKVLGQPCLLQVKHEEYNGNLTSNVGGILKLPKGMTVGGPSNDTLFVWLDVEDFDEAAFNKLSDRVKETIQKSPEYKALKSGVPADLSGYHAGVDPDDVVPF